MIQQENPVFLDKMLAFYMLLFVLSISGAIYFTQKVREVPVHELGHVHYVLTALLWANVLANIPFHLVIHTRQFFVFDVIFDAFQLCSVMMIHLLFNRILTFK